MTAELVVPTRQSIPDKMEYARTLAGADLLPKHFQKQPANVLWAIEYAEALRLPTIAAITGVHVMDGKPTPSAALMSALVRRAGHRLRVGYEPSVEHGVRGRAWCVIVRSDDPDFPFRTEWTVERAADAELCTIKDGKVVHRTHNNKTGNWQKHPVAMMKARAISECARDACEEALMGMHYTAEELGADLNESGVPLRATATTESAFVNHAPAQRDDSGQEGDEPEPDWNERIADLADDRDRAGLVALWKQARRLRPDDTELLDRITAAGEYVKAGGDVVDAEVVDEPPPDDAERRTARMFALLGEAGLGGDKTRERRLNLIGNVVGRTVGSSKELTPDDREQVIAALERFARNGDLERAEEAAQEEAAEAQMLAEQDTGGAGGGGS